MKLYVKVVGPADESELQIALSALVSWADSWQLSVSIEKCCVLTIGKGVVPSQFYIKDQRLPTVSSCRDLGVMINTDLSPSLYISDIVRKAHARANMIHLCFISQNVTLLICAFVTYVRPLLERNCVVWSSHLWRDITLIEQVQRRFTKRLRGYRNSYVERLKLLNLDTLEVWRIKFDLIFCYKIIFGLVRTNCDEFFEMAISRTRGHPF